jgi:hypothetical protein
MRHYTVDHRAGKGGRDATLLDEQGRVALRLNGAWAVTDDAGRTKLFLAPDFGAIAKASIVGGLISGVLGVDDTIQHSSPNHGEGAQTVKRAKAPMRGLPVRWTPMATVSRERSDPDVPPGYLVDLHESSLPPVRFAQQADAATLAGYSNGYADRRCGVYDLVHLDGRPVLRHWSSIDRDNHLVGSVFDVTDTAFPLPEAVILCLARFLSWLT